MTVYVDEVTEYPLSFVAAPARKYGAKWSHLWADDVDELHAFAESITLKHSWFQNRKGFPHYDVVPTMREMALSHGAQSKRLGEWLMEQRKKDTP